jgi:hypothetical protein
MLEDIIKSAKEQTLDRLASPLLGGFWCRGASGITQIHSDSVFPGIDIENIRNDPPSGLPGH